MKNIKKLLLVATCIGITSFNATARMPVTCDDWKTLLQNCEAGVDIDYFNMTCSEIYHNWRNCRVEDEPFIPDERIAIKQD